MFPSAFYPRVHLPLHVVLAVAVTCVGPWGCGSDDHPPPLGGDYESGSARPSGDVKWRECGFLDCAEVEVPLDRNKPKGPQVKIALNRVRTSGSYRGTVFVNPGGPGASGKDFVEASSYALQTLLDGFDFIGFDPRGVGDSTPLDCPLDDLLTEETELSDDVDAVVEQVRQAARQCHENNDQLLGHLGSQAVVADIEAIRQALDLDEINWLGISYGTRLAALYARNYPKRTRAVVLDAPMAPDADFVALVEGQFEALLKAHDAFFAACKSGELSCPDEPERAFETLLSTAKEADNEAVLLELWAFLLSNPFGRQSLVELLATPDDQDKNVTLSALYDEVLASLSSAVNLTVHAVDNQSPPLKKSALSGILAEYEKRSPLFAAQASPLVAFAGWEVERDPVPRLEFETDVPVLIIGGVEDSLTPYHWAEELNQSLKGSRLLTSEHYGHGATVFGSRCIFDALTAYLGDLELPDKNQICAAPPGQ